MVEKAPETNEIVVTVPVVRAFLMFFLVLQLALIFILFSTPNDFNKFLIIEPLNEKSIQPLNYNSSFLRNEGVSFILPINLIVLRKNAFPVLIQELTTEIEIDGLHTGFLLIKRDYLITGPRIAITLYPHVKLYGSAARFVLKDGNDFGVRVKLSMVISINGLKRKYSEEIIFVVCISSECIQVKKDLTTSYVITDLNVF